MLNLVTGIDRPTSGEVFVAGHAVHKLNQDRLARWRGRCIGVIFQFFQLLPSLSFQGNVILPMALANIGRPRERKLQALHLPERVGIAQHADKLPGELSGGQQQRAAIARALANDPPLIVADEPTGNLDSASAESVFALFEQLVRQGKTVMVVTHDNQCRRAHPRDRSYARDRGHVARHYPAFSRRGNYGGCLELADRRAAQLPDGLDFGRHRRQPFASHAVGPCLLEQRRNRMVVDCDWLVSTRKSVTSTARAADERALNPGI